MAEDLADEIGISHQVLSEWCQRGQYNLVENALILDQGTAEPTKWASK